ncbi:MAG TPA: hypothetical protein VGH54_22080 [Mycobacterium sp.]|uniref:hypothetical protein n=1 Tax=Mycobacterium sp. TaxID=1785 RepID=UPI002F400754
MTVRNCARLAAPDAVAESATERDPTTLHPTESDADAEADTARASKRIRLTESDPDAVSATMPHAFRDGGTRRWRAAVWYGMFDGGYWL